MSQAPNKSGFFSGLLKWPGAGGQQQPQPQSGMQQQGSMNPGGQQQPGGQGPTNGPGSSMNLPNNDQGSASPLDPFKEVWQTPTNQQQPADPFSTPLFNTDPQKILQAASQQDFLRNIPPELKQKAMSGDSEAMMQIINISNQQALALGLQLQTATTEQAGQFLGQRFQQAFPQLYKKHAASNLPSKNGALDHPAVQPLVANMRERMIAMNPDKRPEEIQAMVEEYFGGIAEAFTGGSQNNQQQTQPQMPGGGTDFSTW